jgi:pimeloyl-ACP methyl ester carboxylesterase
LTPPQKAPSSPASEGAELGRFGRRREKAFSSGYALEHAADVRAVVADLRARFPAASIFLVGTSRGSVSVASLGARITDGVAGVVLTSTMFRGTGRRSPEPGPGLGGFDFATIKVPALVVHHREDTCHVTPYADAERLGKRFPLVSVRGGLPAKSEPCQALSAHGYLGKEAETIEAIAHWMLKKPYRREVD